MSYIVKSAGLLALFIWFIYLTWKLFYYFSYWGLGLSIVLLAVILVIIFIFLIISLFIHYKKEIIFIIQHIVLWLKTTKSWQNFNRVMIRKFPWLWQFITVRFKKDKIFGLYFTIGASISFIFFLLFLGIIQDFLFKDSLILADLRIIYLFRTIASINLNHFFALFTVLGNWQTIILLFIALAIFWVLSKNYRHIIYLGLSIGGGSFFSYLVKFIFHRPRPPLAGLIEQPTSYGLPSGHALLAVCFYGFFAHLLIKYFKKIYQKIIIAAFFLALIALIGLSRVYLGVHYLSDVLAGWYLGFFTLTLSITLFEVRNKSRAFKGSLTLYSKKIDFASTHPRAEFILKKVRDKFYKEEVKIIKVKPAFRYIIAIIFIIISVYFINYSYKGIKFMEPVEAFKETNPSDFIKTAPLFSENLLGQKMEPISFIVIGDGKKINEIFAKAGWEKAVAPSIESIFKLSSAVAKNLSYPDAPMTPSFYNNKTNDLGFEKQAELNTARQRHHTRYWRTGYKIDNKEVWAATASFDTGIEIGSVIRLPTHKISPDIDKEREFIVNDLINTGLIINYKKINLVGKTTGINAAGDRFFTDGQAYVIYF